SMLPKLPNALHQRLGGIPRGLSRLWSGAPIALVGARWPPGPTPRPQRTTPRAADRGRGGAARPVVAGRAATAVSDRHIRVLARAAARRGRLAAQHSPRAGE